LIVAWRFDAKGNCRSGGGLLEIPSDGQKLFVKYNMREGEDKELFGLKFSGAQTVPLAQIVVSLATDLFSRCELSYEQLLATFSSNFFNRL